MASGVNSGRGQGARGRKPAASYLLLGMLGFFLVATGVIARRTFGISEAKALRERQRQRDAVDAERVKLEIEIREASSRTRLVPIAESRLHMYVPPDSQVIILPREPRTSRPRK